MNEQELRVLVREAIARGLTPAAGPAPSSSPAPRLHASHGILRLPAGSELDGPCLIEPAVACTHCGYCQSYGH